MVTSDQMSVIDAWLTDWLAQQETLPTAAEINTAQLEMSFEEYLDTVTAGTDGLDANDLITAQRLFSGFIAWLKAR
jgi:hypothetical protein